MSASLTLARPRHPQKLDLPPLPPLTRRRAAALFDDEAGAATAEYAVATMATVADSGHISAHEKGPGIGTSPGPRRRSVSSRRERIAAGLSSRAVGARVGRPVDGHGVDDHRRKRIEPATTARGNVYAAGKLTLARTEIDDPGARSSIAAAEIAVTLPYSCPGIWDN